MTTLNPIAQTAIAALDRAMGANMFGEIPGHGPAWACERFGAYGHFSAGCIKCTSSFIDKNNEQIKGAMK
jgi:hypothetical protein